MKRITQEVVSNITVRGGMFGTNVIMEYVNKQNKQKKF